MTTSQQPTGRHANANVPPTAYYPPQAPPQIPQQWAPHAGYTQTSYPQASYPPPYQPGPPAPQQQLAPKKRRKWPFVVGGILAFLVLVGMINGGNTTPAATPVAAPATAAPAPAAQAPVAAAPVAPAPQVSVPAAAAPAAPVETGPTTTATDGTYEVGVDLAAGRYKTTGPDGSGMNMCYNARLKNDSGDFDAIIANNIVQGPSSVTVKKGEFIEFSGGCEWTKQ